MSHVPEENLGRYRALRGIANLYESLGSLHSGIQEYAEANRCWAIEAEYRKRMMALRARPADSGETVVSPDTSR